MALNYPGPYQLRVFYSVDAQSLGNMTHVLQMNLDCEPAPDPGDPFTDINIVRRGTTPMALHTMTNAFVVLMKALLDADDATIDYAELWEFDPGTFDASYISSYTIGVAGTGVGTAIAAAQSIYVFRSIEGGTMRVYLQEANTAIGASLGYGDMGSDNQDFVDWFTNEVDATALARDTSYALAFTKLHPGQSEKLFKARYR